MPQNLVLAWVVPLELRRPMTLKVQKPVRLHVWVPQLALPLVLHPKLLRRVLPSLAPPLQAWLLQAVMMLQWLVAGLAMLLPPPLALLSVRQLPHCLMH